MGDGHKLICHTIDSEYSFWELVPSGASLSSLGNYSEIRGIVMSRLIWLIG